ncbi:vegetative incompatibility protein HET-E-1 [Dothidotthia symphoricarpi CBS 119687]|uniref:Vegetative incompatibility protein HET-E-1 n=1 Tax=Dothidotthia symphoricarpi CBS 119687 TaxID=1392245 RepID=A0A6A6A7Y0_9PLEO|nr:vegetative incompatibility protein HET-E-1 [Dothidotthia symphoricarpi CBS 119687]KAF2127315.1 vegetative incompatibility protein HET-E-1 [Dothidotthia symphoricarpi CBS 119687]
MRLLRVEASDVFSLEEHVGRSIPRYAILSHTWGADSEEVTFRDLVEGKGKDKTGYRKLAFCGKQAKLDGLQYFWVDTCCIDKTSSAELQEAITSMFRWYQNAEKCYVYLSDVPYRISDGDDERLQRWKPAFKKSRWFTRGWTLQELVAPASVEFFSSDEQRLGSKHSLEESLHDITGIAIQALQGTPMPYFGVGERMSWAEKRETKREEDAAYSLLGIFDVYMPLIYGEGRQNAFSRLRKEISDLTSINLPIAKGASFDSHMEEHNARCLPDTRTELLNHIKEWANDKEGKPIFWLSGMAGTGKSTIARTVAQSFACQGQLGSSFFFKKGEGERGNASRFFTTIAVGLVACEPGMIPGIRNTIDTDSSISEKALIDQFEKLILHPLSAIPKVPSQTAVHVVVVDALDECEREEDIRAILQLLARTKEILSVSLRILVTSRPELPIRLGFKQMLTSGYQDVILHEVPKSTIEHDIRLFLEHKLRDIQQQRLLSPEWPRTDQIQALVELAVPLFIYAATVCRYVGTKGGDPEELLNKVLEYRKPNFSQLDRAYLPVLDQLLAEQEEDDKEPWLQAFRELVGSIVVLESPLFNTSLSCLLQISQKQIRCRLDSMHSVLNIPNDENIPIRILHLSFREFLVNPQKRAKNPFWVDEKRIHMDLARRCLELMCSSNGLRRDICHLVKPGVLRNEVDERTIASGLPPELQYACRYWVHHLEKSQNHIEDGDTVHSFLQTHFLYWLEAMSLLGEVYSCIHFIDRLQALVNSNKSTVRFFLHDAQRFTLRFQHILENAPLQVYSSALVFAPDTSVIRNIFLDHIKESIELLSDRVNDWNACRSTLEGHARDVTAVTFSPDGRMVVSSSADGTIRVWEVATGLCRITLDEHTSSVFSVAFSPDGQLLASASPDKTIQLWETTTWSHYVTLQHSHEVFAVAFSPELLRNNQLIASGSSDGTVRLWDTPKDFHCTTKLEGHTDSVVAVAFSPDGQVIASGSSDHTVRIWDRATLSCRITLKGHSSWMTAVAFSPDSKLVASASGDGRLGLTQLYQGNDTDLSSEPNSTIIGDTNIRTWDVGSGLDHSMIHEIRTIEDIAFSPNGQLIAAAIDDNTIQMWNSDTGSRNKTLGECTGKSTAVSFSPDGQLVASGSHNGIVQLWDLSTDPNKSIPESRPGLIDYVATSPNGQLFVTGGPDKLQIWDAATGFHAKTLDVHSGELGIKFSLTGLLLAAVDQMCIRLWDTTTWSCCTLEGCSFVSDVSFSPDGLLLASGSSDGAVRLWSIATRSCCSILEGHSEEIFTVSFSPDNKLVASGSDDWTVRLWNVLSESCLTLEGHTGAIVAVAFSPDIRLLASASQDQTISLWDTGTGSCRYTLNGHFQAVTVVAFSPDTQLLASGSWDKTIRLWDVTTGLCCYVYETILCQMDSLAFLQGGTHLQTERGIVSIPTHLLSISPSPSKPPLAIFVNDQWICVDGSPVVWLPPEYRPVYVGISGSTVCLASRGGKLTFVRLRQDSETNT